MTSARTSSVKDQLKAAQALVVGLLHSRTTRPDGKVVFKNHAAVGLVYAPIKPPGENLSGATIFDSWVGLDQIYPWANAEATLCYRYETFFRKLAAVCDYSIDIACGGETAATRKTAPLLKLMGLDSKSHASLDENDFYATSHAAAIKKATGSSSYPIIADATKPFQLPKNLTGTAFATMFGGTIAQYPPKALAQAGDKTLEDLLESVGQSLNHNAVLFIPINTNTDPHSAVAGYRGNYIHQAMQHVAKTINACTDDKSMQAGDLRYSPDWDPVRKSVLHQYIAAKKLTLPINGETFEVPAGAILEIGESQMTDIFAIEKSVTKSGWSFAPILRGSGTIDGLVLIGKNVPKDKILSFVDNLALVHPPLAQEEKVNGPSSTLAETRGRPSGGLYGASLWGIPAFSRV